MRRYSIVLGSLFGLGLFGAVIFSLASLAAVEEDPSPSQQREEDYEFAPPAGNNWLRMYRVNRATGAMGACQFVPKENSVGTTVCFPAGEGAGAQADGEYGIRSTNLSLEGGIFRVNKKTGEMSACYVSLDKVVCTDPTF